MRASEDKESHAVVACDLLVVPNHLPHHLVHLARVDACSVGFFVTKDTTASADDS